MHQFPQILRFPIPPTPSAPPCDRSVDEEHADEDNVDIRHRVLHNDDLMQQSKR